MASKGIAKRKSKSEPTKARAEPLASLELRLFAPGMSIMHRAGLGGLACTLKAMEREYAAGNLEDKEVPGAPWPSANGGRPKPPWTIEADAVTLHFGKPEQAGEYLKRLFHFGFDIRGGIIYLPGQYAHVGLCDEVRAELQAGAQLSFLQHGPTCGSRSGEATVSYSVDDKVLTITHDVFTSYKHQGWYWLERRGKKTLHTLEAVSPNGCLSMKSHPIDGAIVPGAIVRHSKLNVSAIEQADPLLICLHFALVGCFALRINPVVGVLLVPEVEDLSSFTAARPLMTPRNAKECRITSAGDAALQVQIRVHSAQVASGLRAPACYAMTLQPTAWAKQQKSRVSTVSVPAADGERLDKFRVALAELPPRIAQNTKAEGKGGQKARKAKYFWADSVIRPLVADNLALGRPWYAGFTRLMVALGADDKPLRDKIRFEKKGLHAMTEKMGWDSPGEDTVVRAVHEALRNRYGQIADENRGNAKARENRWKGEYDRWRLAFAGAKTADQLRGALVDLWSRGRTNSALQGNWQNVLSLLAASKWQLVRDLALLALASYQGLAGEGDDLEEPSAKPAAGK